MSFKTEINGPSGLRREMLPQEKKMFLRHQTMDAQLRVLKLVPLEPPGNEDSEYVFNFFLACL
jgi:hypothetical protein